MEIKINTEELLTGIIERDGSVHSTIRNRVSAQLVDELSREIKSEFIENKWNGGEEISKRVLDDLENKQKELVIKILKEFYDSYRYKKSNLEILKKLKEFIGEN